MDGCNRFGCRGRGARRPLTGVAGLIPALLLVLLAALVPRPATAAEGKQAPDFSLPDLSNRQVRLAQVDAKHPVLLSFWATWCVPCPQEMQHLQRFYAKYGKAGLEILAISIDGPKTVSRVKPFVKGRNFTFPVLLDTNNDVKRLYQVSAVPSLFLLRPGGEIAFQHIGYKPGDEVTLEREIRGVLGLAGEEEGGAETSGSQAAPGAAPQDSTDAPEAAAPCDSSAAPAPGAQAGPSSDSTGENRR